MIYSNNEIRLCNVEEREFTHDEKVNLCGVQIYLMLETKTEKKKHISEQHTVAVRWTRVLVLCNNLRGECRD